MNTLAAEPERMSFKRKSRAVFFFLAAWFLAGCISDSSPSPYADQDSWVIRETEKNGADYDVEINLEHPRSSKCNCPHANGKRIICKHMVALYFTAFPKEAERFYNDTIKAQQEEEERQENLENALVEHISKMKKSELQEALLQVLFDGPEWQYEHFLRDYVPEYWD